MNTQFFTKQMRVPTNVEQWAKAALAAFISGAANSFLTAAGIGVANTVGVQVQQLNGKQLVATTVIGGLVGMAMYLKQSPVPPSTFTDATSKPNPPVDPATKP